MGIVVARWVIVDLPEETMQEADGSEEENATGSQDGLSDDRLREALPPFPDNGKNDGEDRRHS